MAPPGKGAFRALAARICPLGARHFLSPLRARCPIAEPRGLWHSCSHGMTGWQGDDERMRLTPEVLLAAYSCGLFPMAESRQSARLFWLDPPERGILPLDSVHIPRSLAKTVRRERFRVTIDRAFAAVIRACAEPAPGREDSWINPTIENLYEALFHHGRAHSVECWHDGKLVGGLYGVSLGAAFFGESMFHRMRDASKVALVHLLARLRCGGYRLLDTQFVTPHLARFGAIAVPRARYHELLARALRERGDFYRLPEDASGAAVLQAITQRS